MRVAVVGASSGLGRCIGVGLAQRGEQVALLARRKDLLETAAVEAGGDAAVVPCDVTDDVSCRSAIDESVSALGGLDALLYCTGMGNLARIEDLEPDTWHELFATNVVGAHQVTRCALPHLQEAGGMAGYLSTVSASLTSPWPGLAGYAVTKAALDKLIEAWRGEHPTVGFSRIVVGECIGGEGDGVSQLTRGWDSDLAGEMFDTWIARGLMTHELMDVEHLVGAVHGVLRCGSSASIPTVAITPRRPF